MNTLSTPFPRTVESGAELLTIVRDNFFRSVVAGHGRTLEEAFPEARHIQFGYTAMDMLLQLLAEQTCEDEHMTLEQPCDALVRAAHEGARFDGVVVHRYLGGEEEVLWRRDEGDKRVSLDDICEQVRLPACTRPAWHEDHLTREYV